MMTKTPAEYRRSELAKIHIAKKDLALDDDTYRDILQRVCKVESASKLDSQGRFKLLQHFESLGWKKTRPKYGRKPRVNGDKTALMGKLEALLADGRMPWAYADSMAKRMFKVDKVGWLDAPKLHKLVAALQIQANRTNGGK
ncbi:MAG: regulatory protein GemA [Ghiorsea sp.]|nr:regulatory protein GemA [Ghiorsea sp.]